MSERIISATLLALLLVSVLGSAFAFRPVDASGAVGVKAGEWIIYDCTVTGAPPGATLPDWMKVEFLNVEGTQANTLVTMHMSNGTEQNQTMTMDIAAGGGTLGTFSGIVIPANSTAGDSIYISGYGNLTIDSEVAGVYAGARRKLLFTSLSQQGTYLAYYWDKQTGVMVEAEASYPQFNMTAGFKATRTNMWLAPTTIRLTPSEISATAGGTFTVNVTIANVTDLYTWQIELFFDQNVLNFTDAWYPDDHVFAGKEIVSVNPVIDKTEGYVCYGCTLLGEEETFNGSGTLCQIRFTGVSPGKSPLEFSGPRDTFLLDSDLNDIPCGTFDGNVIVERGLYYDLNNDGKVDVGDVSAVALAFGSRPGHPRWNPAADINKDGRVDIMDIFLIGKNFKKPQATT